MELHFTSQVMPRFHEYRITWPDIPDSGKDRMFISLMLLPSDSVGNIIICSLDNGGKQCIIVCQD